MADHDRTVEQLAPLDRSLYESFRVLGLTESQALDATRGRCPAGDQIADPFGRMVATFQAAGLSESQAHTAAVGRSGSEREARQSLREATGRASLTAGERDRHGLTATGRQLLESDRGMFERQGRSPADAERLAWDAHDRREARVRGRQATQRTTPAVESGKATLVEHNFTDVTGCIVSRGDDR